MWHRPAVVSTRPTLLQTVETIADRPYRIALLCLLISLATRFFAFDRSVIDWDETTYLLGARALLDGKVMYVDFWDFKPPGFFWLLTGLEAMFDDAILPLRVAAMLSVAATGFVLSMISLALAPRQKTAALFAGLLYIVLISTNGLPNAISASGLDANTEHFFILFTCIGMYLVVRGAGRPSFALLAGLSIGTAFVIKYYVIADFLALLLAIWWMAGWRPWKPGWPARQALTSFLLAGIGMVMPFLGVAGWYWMTGFWSEFAHAAFSAGPSYIVSQSIFDVMQYWGEFLYMGGLATVCFGAVAWRLLVGRTWRDFPFAPVLFIWLLAVLAVITLTGRNRFHYLFQALPPLCLLGAQALNTDLFSSEVRYRRWLIGLTVALVLPIPIVDYLKYEHTFKRPDVPRMMAEYIERNASPDVPIYFYNCCHVGYYLTGRLPPTPYYQPSIVYQADYVSSAGFETRAELERIRAQKPEFIVVRPGRGAEYVEMLTAGYRPDTTFADSIVVYRRE
ncbi:MAG: hypothetical protein E4H28_01470 [Gemmatimonadales bacterium]|nr:MAG: hypothetical protein E4H28_01470 [Gemmatimonadales bacterium]